MQDLDYILKLFEAKGWNLYEGSAGSSPEKIVARGRAATIRKKSFYHIMPAATRHDDFGEVAEHLVHAKESGNTPKYDDKVNRGPVHGIYVSDVDISFVSDTDSFAFPLDSVADVEDAIKFSVSNYNIAFFDSVEEIVSFVRA